jgi:hypothetical protein
MLPEFQQFIGIDWSGAKNTPLRGLQVAVIGRDDHAPALTRPSAGSSWTRGAVLDHVIAQARDHGPVLAGFDFSFSFPWCDHETYFPEYGAAPPDRVSLWSFIDDIAAGEPDFYAATAIGPASPVAAYFNAPGNRGTRFNNRRLRVTEQRCADMGTTPSCTFNGVGPGSVGTGSAAGMRLLHHLVRAPGLRTAVWPFDTVSDADLVAVEIFPRLYAKAAGVNPRDWKQPGFLPSIFHHYGCAPEKNADADTEDKVDALLSAAALRHLSDDKQHWHPATMHPEAAAKEGWIFGVV